MKLFKNKKLILIVMFCLISLAVFLLMSSTLYKSNEHNFVLDGYVISSSKKIFFNKNSSYKDSLDSKISFKSLNKENIKVSNSSFIHYNNNSIGVFTNSYLLDLDNVSDSLINYYIINKDDVIMNNKNIYSLEKYNVSFRSFLTFTGDNKFIVAGDEIKLSNDRNHKDYFYEITYQNEKVFIQTETEMYEFDPSLIDVYINNKIMLDLSTKQICLYNDKQKDCLYNIDDITNLEEESGKINNNVSLNNTPTFDKKDNYNLSGIESILEPKIDIVNFNVTHGSIEANFEIIDPNKMINDDLKVTIIDKKSGDSVVEIKQDPTLNFININSDNLAPSNEYLLIVNGSYKYQEEEYEKNFIQKLFETKGLNISVRKDYSFQNEIGFKINTQNTIVDSFEINILDDTGKFPQSAQAYICDNSGEVCNKLDNSAYIKLNSENFRDGGILKYTDLESDKQYTIVIDNHQINNQIFSNQYMFKLITNTLKEKPKLDDDSVFDIRNDSGIYSTIYNDSNNVEIIDDDNSIINYKYVLHDIENEELKVIDECKSLTKCNLTNYLKEDINYELKLYAVYNDNEKNVELNIANSGQFNEYGDLKYSIEFEVTDSFYEHVTGTFKLIDTYGNYVENYPYDLWIEDDTGTIKLDINENELSKGQEITFNNLKESKKYNLTLYSGVENINTSLATFTIVTESVPQVLLNWDAVNYIPLSITSYAGDIDESVEKLKGYLSNAYIKLIKLTNEGSVVIGESSGKETLNKLLTENKIQNIAEELGIANCNDLYSCLDPGTYNLEVNIEDTHGTIIHLENNIMQIIKGQAGTISVNEYKDTGILNGYKISANINEGGSFSVYNVDNCTTEFNEETNKNYIKECQGELKSTAAAEKITTTIFEFDEDNYIKGNGYVFSFKNNTGTIYSDIYYPEKETPIIKLKPLISENNLGQTVTYEISITDPDDALYRDQNGNRIIFYKFGDGVEQKADIKCAQQDEKCTIEITKDASATSNRYIIYYKADISKLYDDGLKTETLLYDYFDSGEMPSFNFDIKNGKQILLKNGKNTNRIFAYKIYDTDNTKEPLEIKSINDCEYDESKYYGCIFIEQDMNINSVTALYDSGISGFDLLSDESNQSVFQEQDSFKYLEIKKENNDIKITKKDNAIELVSTSNNFEYIKENINVTSGGVRIDDTYFKPKRISETEKQILENNGNNKITETIVGEYIDLYDIKTEIDSFSFKYKHSEEYTGDVWVELYSSKNTNESNFINSYQCNKDKKTCEIDSLNINTQYYYIITNKEIKKNEKGEFENIEGKFNFYDYKNFKQIVYSTTTKNLNIDLKFAVESGSGTYAKRVMKLITDTYFEYGNIELCRIGAENNCLSSNKDNSLIILDSQNNKTESKINLYEYDENSIKSSFIFDSVYVLKFKKDEKDRNVLYETKITIPSLKDIKISSVVNVERLKYTTESENDENSPYLELKINNIFYDEDNILEVNEDDIKYTISLQECSSIGDDRCSTVVEQQQFNLKATEDIISSVFTFKNVKEATKYKINYSYKVYQPNNIDQLKVLDKNYNQYIYVNSNDEIISIGDIETKIDTNYNNTKAEMLVLSYYNSNLLEKIDEIAYTLYSNDGETYSFIESNPTFIKYSICTSECKDNYYQNTLNLDQFNLSNSTYNIEISYRSEGKEVDRYSETFEYDSTIYIYKIEDLVKLANLVNGGDDCSNTTYILANNLDFQSDDDYYDPENTSYGDINGDKVSEGIKKELTTGNGWLPIGFYEYNKSEKDKPFSGVFDGNNKTISNLYIKREVQNVANGLFAHVKDSSIIDLNLENVNIKGKYILGSLVGYSLNSNIVNISANGNIESATFVGGIVGRLRSKSDESSIINCYSNLKINGTSYVGGIVGDSGATGVPAEISKNYSTSTISGTSNVGGIIGSMENTKITENTFNGYISTFTTKSSIKNIGGIIGSGVFGGTINNNSSSGVLDCSSTQNCGGIAGRANFSIHAVFSTMTILINNKGENAQYIGGLVGSFLPLNPENDKDITLKDFKYNYYMGTIKVNGYSNSENIVNGLGTLVGINGDPKFKEKEDLIGKVSISKCYSLGNIVGNVNISTGIGMIGINIFSIDNLYNGGQINYVSNSSTQTPGAIVGSSGEFIMVSKEILNENNQKEIIYEIETKSPSNNNVVKAYSEVNELKKLNLYTIQQTNLMRNSYYSEIIEPTKFFKATEYNWFRENWTEIKKDGSLYYPLSKDEQNDYYPRVEYRGYDLDLYDGINPKRTTSNKILIG